MHVSPVGWDGFQNKYLCAGLVKYTLFTLSLGNRGGGPRLMDRLLGDYGELLYTHIIPFSLPVIGIVKG